MRAFILIAALCLGALACTSSSRTCQTWECPGQTMRAQSCTDGNSPITTWTFGSLICEIDANHTASAASLSCNAALATFCAPSSVTESDGGAGGSGGGAGGGAGGGSAGGAGGGSANEVDGGVHGISIPTVAEATSLVVDPNCSGTQTLPSVLALVILDTQAGLCASFTSHVDPASNTVLRLSIGAVALNGSTSAVAITPGSYTINNLTPVNGLLATAVANLSRTDAQCGVTADVSASSGSITVDTIASRGLTGSFNLQFGGDALSGTFDAPDCGVSQLTYCAGQQSTDTCVH